MLRLTASVWIFEERGSLAIELPHGPDNLNPEPRLQTPSLEQVEFPELRDGWSAASAYVQVGLLNPRRPMLLHALGRKEGQQNHRIS